MVSRHTGWRLGRGPEPSTERGTDAPTRPLLVEDDVRIRQALGLALVDEGCADVEAVDAESAPATPADTRVDVVLLDLMLPGIDGWRSAGPCAPVDRHLLRWGSRRSSIVRQLTRPSAGGLSRVHRSRRRAPR
ncbi:response regulator [Pseudonocardia oceani]|uniref:response regulator n=1 Tax=Pseudonocardia oceani TaxID=2792013 RepID=UPI0027E301C6|nr:response regulator [Pseudonocardia oceani]